MFEKYDETARRVLFFSRYEAGEFGSCVIEPEHLLLGLIHEDQKIAKRLGTTFEEIRKDLKSQTPIRRTVVPTSADLPFSEECKSALNAAANESERLAQDHIGTEHILFGLLQGYRSIAAEILAQHGIRPVL